MSSSRRRPDWSLRALALGVTLIVGGCAGSGGLPIGGGPAAQVTSPPSSAGTSTCPTAQPAPLAAGQTKTVTIVTPQGTIVIKVDGGLAPIATGNFVALAACGYYTGVVFSRLVPGFVIQGGDGQYGRVGADGKLSASDAARVGSGNLGYTIADDPVTTTYVRGTVAMARIADQPNSQGSQFFIVLNDAAAQSLIQANDYAILGTVSVGMDVVDAIAALPNSGDPDNAALNPVPMTSVTVGP
jgi:cyclophilin family peptidyl-prolyl cis-trans isomerase